MKLQMSEGFRWNAFNIEHAVKHGCSIAEIEMVVSREIRRARKAGFGKWMVEGRGIGDRMIRVIFVYDGDGKTIYVIHAMPLTTRRRRRTRR